MCILLKSCVSPLSILINFWLIKNVNKVLYIRTIEITMTRYIAVSSHESILTHLLATLIPKDVQPLTMYHTVELIPIKDNAIHLPIALETPNIKHVPNMPIYILNGR